MTREEEIRAKLERYKGAESLWQADINYLLKQLDEEREVNDELGRVLTIAQTENQRLRAAIQRAIADLDNPQDADYNRLYWELRQALEGGDSNDSTD